MFDCAFYISTEAQAREIAAEMAHPEEALETTGLTDVDLANVFAIAAAEDFDFDKHEWLPVVEEQDYQLYQMPPRFQKLLAEVDVQVLKQWADEWAQAEEFRLDEDDEFQEEDEDFVEQLAQLLISLSALAKQAAEAQIFVMIYTDWLPGEEEIAAYEREMD